MKVLRTISLVLAVAVLSASQVTIPDTAPGRLLRGWLDTFNAGEVEGRTKFIRDHYSEAVLHGIPPEGMARRGMEFRDDVGGGFDLHAITESTATEIKAVLQQKSGFGWASIGIKVDLAKPSIISALELDQMPTPDDVRPAREDEAALIKDVDQLTTKLTNEDRFSGVVLIAKNGKSLLAKAYGYSDREKKLANNIDTKFRIGSMNKMFTSVAIAQLVQQGKLKYTDTLAQVLPDYPNKEVAQKITIHHLLTHTSGLGDYFSDSFDQKKGTLRDLKDYLPFFVNEPLQFEPGKGWAYSNAGMLVAGLVVEKVSGQDYFDYVRQNVYKPAGMKDSDSYEKTKPQPNQSKGYMKENGRWVSNYETLPLMGSSAGGGDSTAPDLLRFADALQNHKLVNAELTNMITTGKVEVRPHIKYAYGFEDRTEDGKRVVGHGGGAPGMNGDLRIYWDSGYTVVVLSNFSPPVADQLDGYIRERIKL
ncbi:MAG TPA: serine hydrolase domain-containing protein [Terriglobales bacterium]|jgi:CubicO group peptidase (beta-lactamase class C family)|nr:serine hydrolase domain-containing protein [Terriglobales bacterium]